MPPKKPKENKLLSDKVSIVDGPGGRTRSRTRGTAATAATAPTAAATGRRLGARALASASADDDVQPAAAAVVAPDAPAGPAEASTAAAVQFGLSWKS